MAPYIFRWSLALAALVPASVFGVCVPIAQSVDTSNHFAQYYPPTTVAFAQVNEPAELLDTIENHAVVGRVIESDPVQKFAASPQFVMAMFGKSLVESRIGHSLEEAAKIHLANGMAIGFDPKTDGVAIVFRSDDEAKLRRLAGTLLSFIANDADEKGKPVPFKKQKYRGVVTAQFDDFVIGRYQTWFIVSNKSMLAKQIADNLIDGSDASLATQSWFENAARESSRESAWMAIDLNKIRKSGRAKELFQGRTDNPGAELLLGGLFDALQHAPWASISLNLDNDFNFAISLPFDPQWANENRSFFYGDELDAAAPEPLSPKNRVATFTTYRDLAQWWLSKEDLYEEAVIAKLAQADSQLSNIFSGMDLGEDVLGSLEPGLQIVVAEKEFDDQYAPDIRLPAFAVVGKMKDPEKIRRKLKIVFQSAIGFVNLGLGMEGQPQLDLETETIGDTKLSSAQYVIDDGTEPGLLILNFSPTMATVGPHVVLSSDRELAIELAELAAKPLANGPSTMSANTRFQLTGETLRKILTDNREALIAQNMLEKGHQRKQAEQEIEILLFVIKMLKDTQFDLHVHPDKMQFTGMIRFVE